MPVDDEMSPGDVTPLPHLPLSAALPDPIEDPAALTACANALAAATGPVAVDAERASGYRYGQRCYLVQLRRESAGTFLVDPIAVPDLSALDTALADSEWVVHAASQDLPCLAEVGLRPRSLFDTELAARLAGYERVGLATLVERVLGFRLDKGASSADWSQRPLPPALLRYAALDVEVLVALRDHLESVLVEQGKRDWAAQEFAAVAATVAPEPRAEPWRRTSGLHRLRTPQQLAAVRALWEARDEIARTRDIAPGRVLPDKAIVDAVLAAPTSAAALGRLPVFAGRANQRRLRTWWGALASAAALTEPALPRVASADGAPPPTHRWAERDAAAASRLLAARAAVAAVAEAYALPAENLLEPALLRRLCWSPPEGDVPAALRAGGAREWQVTLVASELTAALDLP